MTGMNKLMYLIMFVTVCIFVLLIPPDGLHSQK